MNRGVESQEDIIETLVWAGVTIVVAIVAMLIFRAPLTRLIDRTKKAGLDGVSFEHPPQQLESKAVATSFDELMKHPISASALAAERMIAGEVQRLGLDDQKVRTLLVRLGAMQRVELDFTAIRYAIFGSQVLLLNRLTGSPTGLLRSQAHDLFVQAQATFPAFHAERTFDAWLTYLSHNNLIAFQGDRILISQFGSDFLKYLIDKRVGNDLPG